MPKATLGNLPWVDVCLFEGEQRMKRTYKERNKKINYSRMAEKLMVANEWVFLAKYENYILVYTLPHQFKTIKCPHPDLLARVCFPISYNVFLLVKKTTKKRFEHLYFVLGACLLCRAGEEALMHWPTSLR